jgi:hypothetical protein
MVAVVVVAVVGTPSSSSPLRLSSTTHAFFLSPLHLSSTTTTTTNSSVVLLMAVTTQGTDLVVNLVAVLEQYNVNRGASPYFGSKSPSAPTYFSILGAIMTSVAGMKLLTDAHGIKHLCVNLSVSLVRISL